VYLLKHALQLGMSDEQFIQWPSIVMYVELQRHWLSSKGLATQLLFSLHTHCLVPWAVFTIVE